MSVLKVATALRPSRGMFVSAIILLGMVVNVGSARAAPIDICAKKDTLLALIGFVKTIPEPVNETTAEDFCTVTITNVKFSKTEQGTFFEPDGITVSDILTLSNNATNQGVICFASDPSQGSCGLAKPDMTFKKTEKLSDPTVVSLKLTSPNGIPFEIAAESDCDPAATNKCVMSSSSDSLSILPVVAEPSPDFS